MPAHPPLSTLEDAAVAPVAHATGGGGEGTLIFFSFGGCVLHGFPKEGSIERIFLEKWGSCEQKVWKYFGLDKAKNRK